MSSYSDEFRVLNFPFPCVDFRFLFQGISRELQTFVGDLCFPQLSVIPVEELKSQNFWHVGPYLYIMTTEERSVRLLLSQTPKTGAGKARRRTRATTG